MKLRLQPLSPTDIVRKAIANVKDRAKLQQVELNVSSDPGNQRISADAEHLELALTNVLLNAVESEGVTDEVVGKLRQKLNKTEEQVREELDSLIK